MMQLIGFFSWLFKHTYMMRNARLQKNKSEAQYSLIYATHISYTWQPQKNKFLYVVLTKFILSRTVHPHLLQGITILKDQDTAKMSHKKITVHYGKHITWHLRFTAMTTKTLAVQNVTVYSPVEVPWPLSWCHMPRKQQPSISCLPTAF